MNLLNEASDSKFLTRKWNIANDQSNANYDVGNKIIYSTEVSKSNLYNYNDVCILVGGNIVIAGNTAVRVTFKNCALLTKCITKTDGATMDDAENLDLVMPNYNLIEYISNYSDTTGSLWFYSKNEEANFNNVTAADDDNFKSFKYQTKLTGSTAAANGILEDPTIATLLKYLSAFWRSRKLLLINCKVN